MKDLYTIGLEMRKGLEDALSSSEDVKDAQDCAAHWLEEVCASYISQLPDGRMAGRVRELLSVAKTAMETMSAVSRTKVYRFSEPQARRNTGSRSILSYCAYIPAVLCAACALYALLISQTGMFALCLIAGAVSVVLAGKRHEPAASSERVEAVAQADAQQLMRRCEFLLREMDGQLADMPETPQDMVLPAPILESAQMLLEAQITNDAEYALKSISPLMRALQAQGIEFVAYAPEHAQDFDMLPAPVDGQTIRPALRRGKTLLMRGQATIKR